MRACFERITIMQRLPAWVLTTFCLLLPLTFSNTLNELRAADGDDKLKSEVRQMVEAAIDAGDLPGAIVGLWHDGKWVLREKFGHRAIEPQKEEMTFDTVFDMASITKPVATATSAMMLVQDGKLDLNARVCDYLKDFTGDGREELRVWHLLTHTGGLIPDNALADYQSGKDEAWRRLMRSNIRSTPGTKFAYSDVSFLLLGKVVETISGQSLKEFSAQRVFQPLGMRDSGYVPSKELIPRIAPTEARDGQMLRGEVHDPRAALLDGIAGHAGLFSTLDDIALYAQMMLRNGRLPAQTGASDKVFMRPEIVWTMTRPFTIENKEGFGPVSRTRGWDHHSPYSYNGGKELSTAAFGHGGFTGTVLWIDPDQNLFFVFLSNRLHPDGKGNVNQLAGKIATLAVSQLKSEKKSDSVSTHVESGIDVLNARSFRDLAGKRVGLVTNQTGIDRAGNTTLSLLSSSPNVKLVALFSPEHGIEGKLDVNKIGDSRNDKLNVPIYSLYGDTRKPKPEHLAEVDVLVYDIQDIGTRFYTYIATMKNCLEACAEQHKQFMILDRPNPIGARVAGPMRDPDRSTFVACHWLPVQHGMTVGELALMFQREGKLDLQLTVIPVRGWQHSDLFYETGLSWINPSPNMRTLEAAMLYPGVGLLEMTNISVGRGTDRPFQWIGAPWMDGIRLAQWLNDQQLPGVRAIARKITPDSSKHANVECSGVQFVITDVEKFDALQLSFALTRGLYTLHKDKWESEKLDVLLVNKAMSERMGSGASYEDTKEMLDGDLEKFKQRRREFLLYD